jgi:DNA-binding transcriptional MerR regulator
MSGLSIDTLRYYEREGLSPTRIPRSSTGQRRYGERDVAWLKGLVMLRGTGMSIAGIRELVELIQQQGTGAHLLEILERHRKRVLTDMEQTRQHLAATDKKISAYRAAVAAPGQGD